MAQHNITGQEGEDYAIKFLEEKGHNILSRNYRYQKAEIDIISSYLNTIIFTEVKTRSKILWGLPEESVTSKKQQLISKAASNFMEENAYKGEVRFDIISLTKTKNSWDVFHIEDAFFPIY